MDYHEAYLSGKPMRRCGGKSGVWWKLDVAGYARVLEDVDYAADDWEVYEEPKEPTVTLTRQQVLSAVLKAYEEMCCDRHRIGYLVMTFPEYPKVDLIMKHLGFPPNEV